MSGVSGVRAVQPGVSLGAPGECGIGVGVVWAPREWGIGVGVVRGWI